MTHVSQPAGRCLLLRAKLGIAHTHPLEPCPFVAAGVISCNERNNDKKAKKNAWAEDE